MNLLYCGPYFSDQAIREKPAISQAGVRWSLGLVRALRAAGHTVEVISHVTAQMWPRGKTFWQNADLKWYVDDNCHPIAYPNLPFIREPWINVRYADEITKACKAKHFDAFLCYNTFVPWHVAAMKAARKMGVKCLPIILDGDDPQKDNWKKLLTDNRYADGVVFLSYWLKEHYPIANFPTYQLDGGSEAFYGKAPIEHPKGHKFTVAHTGSLNPKRELAFIAKALKVYRDPDTRFIFTGKIDKDLVLSVLDHDPRVEIKGLVSSEELNRICADVDVFISARSPSIVDFPSKLPNYLAWGRPVVATWIESLSPDYRDLLFVTDGNTPEGMAHQLEIVKNLTLEKRTDIYNRIATWFKTRKTWAAQAKSLTDWIASL